MRHKTTIKAVATDRPLRAKEAVRGRFDASRLVFGLIGIVLSLGVASWFCWPAARTSSVSDYVRIVAVSAKQGGRTSAYNYATAPSAAPWQPNSRIALPEIDDSSSEGAYRASCLAALTREKDPAIMQLAASVRDEMCTDPRRK